MKRDREAFRIQIVREHEAGMCVSEVHRYLKYICIAGVLLLLQACGGYALTPTVLPQSQPTQGIVSPSPLPSPTATEESVEEDENIRVTIGKDTVAISETMEITITVVGSEIYYSVGPCNIWFEMKKDDGWQKVRTCPDTNFTDEPFSLGRGDEMHLELPTNLETEYFYSYDLDPGIYRFAFTYWSQTESSLMSHSPEFRIVE